MKPFFDYFRKKAGLSQQEVAIKLGIKRTRYVNYELGRTEADYSVLLSLSRLFDVSINELLRGPNTSISGEDFITLVFKKETYESIKNSLSETLLLLSKKS